MQEIINAVIIDDDIEHIIEITKCLSGKGIATLPIHYNVPTIAFETCVQAATASPRIIITDIQMTTAGHVPSNADYANVAKCIEEVVKNTSGPYIVLAWTSVSEAFSDLKEYVTRYLTRKNIRLPFYFDYICKNECRPDGVNFSSEIIFNNFNNHLSSQKQIKALMHWEKSVLKAAHDTVNTLYEVSNDQLKIVLGALGECVAGDNLKDHEASAINEALSYILKDKLGEYIIDQASQTAWSEAINPAESNVTEFIKHKLNSILHTELNVINSIICPGDVWIANNPNIIFKNLTTANNATKQIAKFLNEFFDKEKLKNVKGRIKTANAGQRPALLAELKNKLSSRKNAISNCKLVLMEISPSCDFTNKKRALKTLSLGLFIPNEFLNSEIAIDKKSASLIKLPMVYKNKEYSLLFSAKYIMSLSETQINQSEMGLNKVFRIRENLLQSWVQSISSYNSRIGTISFN